MLIFMKGNLVVVFFLVFGVLAVNLEVQRWPSGAITLVLQPAEYIQCMYYDKISKQIKITELGFLSA